MNKITLATNSAYRYNLYDGIEQFSDYSDFIEDLSSLTENDAVALYINSPGGRVDVGVSIINTIRSTNAAVTAIVEGPSYSMASVIALACDSLVMLDNTFLMFHNYSTGAFGKGGELMHSMRHGDEHFNKLMKSVCYPFLSAVELHRIKKDQDLYIYNDDENLEKRIGRHFK